jgi:hypothetical protein
VFNIAWPVRKALDAAISNSRYVLLFFFGIGNPQWLASGISSHNAHLRLEFANKGVSGDVVVTRFFDQTITVYEAFVKSFRW